MCINSKYDVIVHYCIVRDDLDKGTAMAQLVHAAGESSPGDIPSGTHAVVLAAKDEQDLLNLEQRLILKRIPHKAIREPDWNNQLMAIGILPGSKNKLRKHFSNFPLLRERKGE